MTTVNSSAELIAAVDNVGEGQSAVIHLPAGRFEAGSGPIVIDVTRAAAAGAKSITIEGAGMKRMGSVVSGDSGSNTEVPVTVKIVAAPGTQSALSLTLKKLTCKDGLDIETDKAIANLTLEKVHVTVPDPPARDALKFTKCLKVLMQDCEVYGGQDGVNIDGSDCAVHIKDSIIRFAASRGIFANPMFKVEDVEICNCGAYGMKTRAGCQRIGDDNDIQPGPWDHL
jgi:hypothetical protein